jgi:hypothetical protein
MALAAATAAARADLVLVPVWSDATIYSDSTAIPRANGAGQYLFAGMNGPNNSDNIRRSLLLFDVASYVPAGALITDVTLAISVSRKPPTGSVTDPFTLHLALAGWSEGPSDPAFTEGVGTTATTGDVTWLHRSYDTLSWAAAGGDFVSSASATQEIGDIGAYFFSSPGMVGDVRLWATNAGVNYGWFLLGAETYEQSARRFYSADQADGDLAPYLSVSFQIPEPGTLALILLGAGPCAAMLNGRKRRERRGRTTDLH